MAAARSLLLPPAPLTMVAILAIMAMTAMMVAPRTRSTLLSSTMLPRKCETLAAWVASEVVNYIYIKVLYAIRTCHVLPLREISLDTRREHRRIRRRRTHCGDDSESTRNRIWDPPRIGIPDRVRELRAYDRRMRAHDAYHSVLLMYRGYRHFFCDRLDFSLMRWAPLVAAVRRGCRAA